MARNSNGALALVFFSDDTDLWFLKFLRWGFRHCWVILVEDHHLVCIDPMAHITEVTVLDRGHLIHMLRTWTTQNMVMVPTYCKKPERKSAPLAPCSCVETVKRILGLHCPFILTPWQLFKHLIKEDQKWEV